MNVSIIGTGYVGLVTGACLADKGHQVTCVDVDSDKVKHINAGKAPFYEPDLLDLIRRNLGKRFRATLDLYEAVHGTELTLIAVGTPFKGRQIDLTFVRAATEQVGSALKCKKPYHVVVIKSTVVPGTTDSVVLPLLERSSGKRAGSGFGLGMNPEFLSEGEAVRDFMHPDRIVLGGIDDRTVNVMARLYRSFRGVPVLCTGTRTAEMIKYSSNALLAALISFSNEIGNLCSAVGDIDALEVMRGVHLSQYLSPRQPGGKRVRAPITAFLKAGCGFGGSCLPKDVKALIARGRSAGTSMNLLEAVIRVNEGQPGHMLALLGRHFRSLKGVPVAVLGLAFKPGTDDLRESPAIPIVDLLHRAGARVLVYDPVAMPAAQRSPYFNGVTYVASLKEAVGSVGAVVLVTAWPEFRQLPRLLRHLRRPPVVVDGRRILHPHAIERYEGIGRGQVRDTARGVRSKVAATPNL
jgi:UDPglucose 6-dehydrogenase